MGVAISPWLLAGSSAAPQLSGFHGGQMSGQAPSNNPAASNPFSPSWGIDTTSQTVPDPNNPGQTMANPYYGLPAPAAYTPSYNPATMSLAPEVAQDISAVSMGPIQRDIGQFRTLADSKSPSPWATLATTQQATLANNAKEQAAQSASGQTAQADSRLAASGGFSSGARERAQEGGAQNYLSMSQDASRQQGLNDMQIGMNDAQTKEQMMSALPGMDQGVLGTETQLAGMKAGAEGTDISNQINSGNALNSYNQWLAGQQQSLYSGNQAANATAAQKGSCWVISLLSETSKLPKDEPMHLRRLKAYQFKHAKREAVWYLAHGEELVERMKARGYNVGFLEGFNMALMTLLRTGSVAEATALFQTTVMNLLEQYWPECKHPAVKSARIKESRDRLEAAQMDVSESPLCLTNLSEACFV